MPLSYVKQAILFPRLICLASICPFLSSPAHALETVFITGYTTTSGSDTDSVVLKSIDNGLNWTLVDSLLRLRETRSVTALSSTNYFAVGGSAGSTPTGYTFSTTGGARTVTSGLLQSVDVASGTYYAAGATADGSSGTILKSTDGTTWTTQVSSGSNFMESALQIPAWPML